MWPLGVLKKPDLSVLLDLRFEGANGSTVFVDSSLYARTVTTSAGTHQLTTTNPLSGSSSLLLGTNGTITTPNFTTPANNRLNTIEFRLQIDLADIAFNESQGVFVKGFSSSFFFDYSHQCILTRNASGTGGVIRLYYYIPSIAHVTAFVSVSIPDISANNHIAFTRSTNGFFVSYLNGVQKGSLFAQDYQANTSSIDLGCSVYDWATASQTNKFKGRLDNFRLYNVSKYSGTFTPPV